MKILPRALIAAALASAISACADRPALGVGSAVAQTPRLSIQTAVLSPDTAMVAYVATEAWRMPGGVWVVATRPGSAPRQIATGMGPSWSPDAQHLAFLALTDGVLQLWSWDRDSGRVRQVTRLAEGIQPNAYVNVSPGQQAAVRLSWSPDGRRIVFASRVQRPAEPLGDSIPIVLTGTSPSPKIWAGILRHTFGGWHYVNGVESLVMLPDSLGLLSREETVQLLVADAETGEVTQLTRGDEGAFDPAWSPNGRTIAFASGEGAPMVASRLRATGLYLVDADGANRRTLVSGEGRRYSPRWSRDGRTVVFGYQPDPYAPSSTFVVDVETRMVIRDRARVAAMMAHSLPFALRPEVLVTADRSRIELHLPSEPVRVVVDLPGPEGDSSAAEFEPSDSGSAPALPVMRIEWTGARGERITGRLRLPDEYEEGKRYPLVVDPYAEWQAPDTLTAAGYVVFSPQPRAPHDPGGDSFEYRQLAVDSPTVAVDILVEDVMAGVDTLIARGMVDSTKMALVGFSNGGGAVNYLVTRTDRFRCAVAQSPAGGDLTSNFFLDPDGEYILTLLNGTAPWESPETYIQLSPVYFVDRVRTPMLFAIGDEEGIPFILNAMEMYDGLRRLGRPVTLVRYPGQGHGLEGWALTDLATRARRFIDECVS